MHAILMFIVTFFIGFSLYFVAPSVLNIHSFNEITSSENVEEIKNKLTQLEALNKKLEDELFTFNNELSQNKITIDDLKKENEQLKNDLILQIEKDKKNISLLFN